MTAMTQIWQNLRTADRLTGRIIYKIWMELAALALQGRTVYVNIPIGYTLQEVRRAILSIQLTTGQERSEEGND